MRIAIGNDHAATALKFEIMEYVKELGHEVVNFGTDTNDSCNYPEIGARVGHAVVEEDFDCGILICGTGIGISIAANKYEGIRAALCTDCFMAEATRLHNDANILAMGGRVVGAGLALKMVDTFLDTPFSNEERHIRRINMIEK